MLESDPLRSEEEFVSMITSLHEKGDIPSNRIASSLGITEDRIDAWMAGTSLPEKQFWAFVVSKVLSLITEVLRERDYI